MTTIGKIPRVKSRTRSRKDYSRRQADGGDEDSPILHRHTYVRARRIKLRPLMTGEETGCPRAFRPGRCLQCGDFTFEQKPYCPAHLDHDPAIIELRRERALRQDGNPFRWSEIEEDMKTFLEQSGGTASAERMALFSGSTVPVVNKRARALGLRLIAPAGQRKSTWWATPRVTNKVNEHGATA